MPSFSSSPATKGRSLFNGPSSFAPAPAPAPSTTTSTSNATRDREFRPFSMASSTLTVVPPSPVPAAHQQASTLATLQYQSDLIADFWSGSAAGRAPSPPLSSSTHTHSVGSVGGKKARSKWADAIMAREEEKRARGDDGAPEPETRARTMFLFGFVCPFLWIVGLLALFFPTTVRVADLPLHSTEERERRVALYRKAESKWAKRCLWAWVAVMAIVPIVAITATLATKNSSS